MARRFRGGGFPMAGGGGRRNAISIFSLTTSLTNAQIKALPTTPVQVVPAQGAGKIIAVTDAWYTLSRTVPYTVEEESTWQLSYGLDATEPVTGLVRVNEVMQATAGDAQGRFPLLARTPSGPFSGETVLVSSDFFTGANNAPVVIADSFWGVADYEDGDDANTLHITVLYAIIQV